MQCAQPNRVITATKQTPSALGVPAKEGTGVTPGSLRGGGATLLHEATEDMELVRRRGRWSQTKSAEIYIQEVGGLKFMAQLSGETRQHIISYAIVADRAVQLTVSLLAKGHNSEFTGAAVRATLCHVSTTSPSTKAHLR